MPANIAYLIQVLLENNLKARDMNLDTFVHQVSNSRYTGFDLTLMILSKMLKVIIGLVHPDYIWLNHVDVNVREASAIIVYHVHKVFHGTGAN